MNHSWGIYLPLISGFVLLVTTMCLRRWKRDAISGLAIGIGLMLAGILGWISSGYILLELNGQRDDTVVFIGGLMDVAIFFTGLAQCFMDAPVDPNNAWSAFRPITIMGLGILLGLAHATALISTQSWPQQVIAFNSFFGIG